MVRVRRRLENGVDELDDALAEYRARPHRMGAGKLLDQKAREEQHFEAVTKSIRQKAHDSEPAIEEKGRSEREREGKRRLHNTLVAETSPAPRAFPKRLCVSQQRLHGGRRGRALRHDFERQHAFLVAERHQADRQPLAVFQAALIIAARLCRRDRCLIRLERVGQGPRAKSHARARSREWSRRSPHRRAP